MSIGGDLRRHTDLTGIVAVRRYESGRPLFVLKTPPAECRSRLGRRGRSALRIWRERGHLRVTEGDLVMKSCAGPITAGSGNPLRERTRAEPSILYQNGAVSSGNLKELERLASFARAPGERRPTGSTRCLGDGRTDRRTFGNRRVFLVP